MFIIFNLLIVGLVLLIAYWWANEGLFSAVLHLVCVIAAGAIAFAIWEPLAMFLLGTDMFKYSGWGVALVSVFAVSLLILRVASDKIVPANVKFPAWANLTFGGLAGFAAGVLSIGICLIGSGFVQATDNIMGYRGTARADVGKNIEKANSLWLDVAHLTSVFYSKLSVGTMYPDFSGGMPLQQYNPRVDEQATLLRDTYEGKGQLTLKKKDANVTFFDVGSTSGGQKLAVVMVNFKGSAGDFGQQVVLSNSQVRLVTKANGKEEPKIYYPSAWKQKVQTTNDAGEKEEIEYMFEFDNSTAYATSIPKQDHSNIKFIFRTGDSKLDPSYLQIKGIRFDLHKAGELTDADVDSFMPDQTAVEVVERDLYGEDIQNQFRTIDRFAYRTTANNVPSSITFNEKYYILDAEAFSIDKSKLSGSGANTIKGVSADPGTGIVFVDVSPGKPSSFYDLYKTHKDAPIVILDDKDNPYKPIGYYIFNKKKMDLVIHSNEPIQSMSSIKNFAQKIRPNKDIEFKLIFMVTAGANINRLQVGDTQIGYCSVPVEEQRQK
ncbi:MAG: hypothetical protein HOC27_07235 [Phycisphaerae bacterium]|nr:hypothetical protein [Phycisphaerae bacterium]